MMAEFKENDDSNHGKSSFKDISFSVWDIEVWQAVCEHEYWKSISKMDMKQLTIDTTNIVLIIEWLELFIARTTFSTI